LAKSSALIWPAKNMKFVLPQLPYDYDALEPYIDEETMRVHHDKHHQAYVNKLNDALEKYPDLLDKSVESLLKNLEFIPEDIRQTVRNQGGGHYNHSLFWQIMKPTEGRLKEVVKDLVSGEREPEGKLQVVQEIKVMFGSFANFKKQFSDLAAALFSNGWCWLVLNKDGELEILTLPNHDCPISQGQIPLLVLDLWEHAHYLKYQNRRADYIQAWWNVVNWDEVNRNFIRGKLPGEKIPIED